MWDNSNTNQSTTQDGKTVISELPLAYDIADHQEFIDCIKEPCLLLLDINGKSSLMNKALLKALKYTSVDDVPYKSADTFRIFNEQDHQKIINLLKRACSKRTKTGGVFNLVRKDGSFITAQLFINFIKVVHETPAWLLSFVLLKKPLKYEIDKSLLSLFNNEKYLDEVLVIMDYQGNILSANRKHFIINFFASISDSRFNLFENIDATYRETLKARLEKLKKGTLMPPCQYKLNKNNKSAYVEIYSKKTTYRKNPAILSLIRDITVKKENENKLLHTIVQTEEKERQRFARDLHDELGPFLSALKLYMNELQSDTDNPDNKLLLYDYMEEMINDAVDKVKMIASNLTPQNMIDEGLTVSLRKLIQKITQTGQIHIEFITSGKELNIEPSFIITLYRIILELVNNSIKHSDGKNISISLHYGSKIIRLKYADDGKGFDLGEKLTQSQGIGLKSIINRIELYQGSYKFFRRKNRGIEYNILFPISTKS